MPRQTVIAFVEDEPLIRLNGADLLSDAGYRVLEAENADQALAMLAVRRVDLVISDIRMPGISGIALAGLIHRRWPGIKVLLTSGDSCPRRGETFSGCRFLPKPYHDSQLRHEVQALLRSR